MRGFHLSIWSWSAWFVVAVVLIGHSPARSAPHDLAIGQDADISHFDPYYSTVPSDMNIHVNLYDTLVMQSGHHGLVPALATAWQLIDDKTWQFKLREGVMFHNGDPFTAEDVQFSLERAAAENPRTSVYPTLSAIEHVEILDSDMVKIITRYPDPLLPARLSSCGGMILPKQYFERVGMQGFRTAPIGTGAMRFVERQQDVGVIFAANPQYWRTPIPYRRVIFKSYPEVAARIAALLAGEVDCITAVPPEQVAVVEKSGTAEVEGTPDAGLVVFYINAKTPPLDHKLVRQAMHNALDRRAIVDKLWHGRGVVPNESHLAGTKMGDGPDTPPFAYAPQKAKALLATAGYQGEEIKVQFTTGEVAYAQQVTETVAMMLREVGINATVQFLDGAERGRQLRHKAVDGLLLGRATAALLDPDGLFWRVMQPGGLFDYWRHPEWDQLMGASRHLQDQAARLANYRRAAQIFVDEVPMLIVLQPERLVAFKRDLRCKARGDGAIVVYDTESMRQ